MLCCLIDATNTSRLCAMLRHLIHFPTTNKVLDEIANAQMVMCESLEMSLSQTLEAFAGAEFQEAHRLRDEADVLTEAAEESLAKYLHGRHQERSNTEDQISKAMQVASNQFGAALKGFAAARSASGVGSGGATSSSDDVNGGDAGGGSSTATMPRPNTPSRKHRAGGLRRSRSSNADEDPTVAHAVAAANLRQNLEQIRLAQANAELKRFQLLKKLDSLKVRLFIDAFFALVHVSFISVSHILTVTTPTVTLLRRPERTLSSARVSWPHCSASEPTLAIALTLFKASPRSLANFKISKQHRGRSLTSRRESGSERRRACPRPQVKLALPPPMPV